MTDSLTTLISKVQAQLLDDGTRFTTATCTAALRAALKDYNFAAPVHAGTLITVVAEQKEYELSDEADAETAIEILDILEQDTDGEDDESLDYDPYNEDERLFFRLRTALSSGTIIARFTQPHTINGLDSQVESTVPAFYDQVLVDGGSYHACRIRATGRVETINLNREVPDPLMVAAESFKTAFFAGLAHAAKKRAAVGEPDTRAWNDNYHGWDQ